MSVWPRLIASNSYKALRVPTLLILAWSNSTKVHFYLGAKLRLTAIRICVHYQGPTGQGYPKLDAIEKDLNTQLEQVPNIIFDDVPLGGEEYSVEVTKWGENKATGVDHTVMKVKPCSWIFFKPNWSSAFSSKARPPLR